MHAKREGEGPAVFRGLKLTSDNYDVQSNFSLNDMQIKKILQSHSSALMNSQPATMNYHCLQRPLSSTMIVEIEMGLRSLEALSESLNDNS